MSERAAPHPGGAPWVPRPTLVDPPDRHTGPLEARHVIGDVYAVVTHDSGVADVLRA